MDLENNNNLGFISIHRQLMDKCWYSDSNYLSLWLHLLLAANYRNNFIHSQLVKRGQLLTGRKQLSKKLGINESKIERILTYFEEVEQQIEQQKTNKFRIITIKNYDDYQKLDSKTDNRATTEQQQKTQTIKLIRVIRKIRLIKKKKV